MQTVYDLFTGPVATYLLPIRIITKWNAVDRFSATVVRVQVKGCPRDTCENPRGLLEAISCGSSVEALQRLYGSSQMLLDCACVFFSRGDAGFGRWDDLSTACGEDDWDPHSGIGSVEYGKVV